MRRSGIGGRRGRSWSGTVRDRRRWEDVAILVIGTLALLWLIAELFREIGL